MTAAVTRHERATGRKLLGVVAGMAGICLIVGVQAMHGLGEALAAQLAIVAATICYAGRVSSCSLMGRVCAGGGCCGLSV